MLELATLCYVKTLITFKIFKVMCSFFFIILLILNALYDEMLLTQKMLNKVSFLIYIALHLSFEGNIKEKHCISLQVRPFQKKKEIKRKYIHCPLSLLMPIEWAKYRDCTNTFIESFGSLFRIILSFSLWWSQWDISVHFIFLYDVNRN